MQTFLDYNRKTVVLTDAAERHITQGHRDAAQYLDRMGEALRDPSIVCFRERTQGYLYYRRGLTEGKYTGLYLVAIVQFDDPTGRGDVKTWYMTTAPANDPIIHLSPNLMGH